MYPFACFAIFAILMIKLLMFAKKVLDMSLKF